MENKELKIIENLLEQGNTEVILSTLGKIREMGAPQLIPLMVKTYKKNNIKEIQQSIFDLLCDLYLPEVAGVMENIISSEEDLNVKQMLVTSCWYSRVDYSGCLKTFIDIVMGSPFELAFEAFTVIENNEGNVNRKNKEELVDYISRNQAKVHHGNETLVDSLQMIIENFEE
jgi:hypothetical protein